MKIAIDAGHGGTDQGADGPTGLNEAPVVLDISKQISVGLEAWGVSTLLTRAEDVYVALGARCEIANDWAANFFVSIHLNSNGPSAHGIETLYKTAKGKELAVPIQKALVAVTKERDRGVVFREDLYVLNGTRMAAVLVEAGFISNPETEAKFKTPDYRRLIADTIVMAIAEYFGPENDQPAAPPLKF